MGLPLEPVSGMMVEEMVGQMQNSLTQKADAHIEDWQGFFAEALGE
tara:strand:- start:467 stop:604 length:138 start_codon:yes stop_codon:yes gene_type:complete